jgi:septal ring factor EnvC (AmiA/AmiB activator)
MRMKIGKKSKRMQAISDQFKAVKKGLKRQEAANSRLKQEIIHSVKDIFEISGRLESGSDEFDLERSILVEESLIFKGLSLTW